MPWAILQPRCQSSQAWGGRDGRGGGPRLLCFVNFHNGLLPRRAVPYPVDRAALDTKGRFTQLTIYSRVLEGSPDGVISGIIESSQQSCVGFPSTGLTQSTPSHVGRQRGSLCVSHRIDKTAGVSTDQHQHHRPSLLVWSIHHHVARELQESTWLMLIAKMERTF